MTADALAIQVLLNTTHGAPIFDDYTFGRNTKLMILLLKSMSLCNRTTSTSTKLIEEAMITR